MRYLLTPEEKLAHDNDWSAYRRATCTDSTVIRPYDAGTMPDFEPTTTQGEDHDE